MPKMGLFIICCLLILTQPGGCSGPPWSIEAQIWSSPYAEEQVYSGTLSYTLRPHGNWSGRLTLPLTLCTTSEAKWEPFRPQLSVDWSKPLSETWSGGAQFTFTPAPWSYKLKAGAELLLDPVIVQGALLYQEQKVSLEGGAVFAVNERWALGAHLHYTDNSLLTVELHYTFKSGKQGRFSYAHTLDGTLQCLGVRIAF